MHDLILAKQISDLVNHLSVEHKLNNVVKVSLEVGDIGEIHQHKKGEEHSHDIRISNLKFHLKNFHPNTKFQIRRKNLEGWKLKEIEGE